MIDQSPEAAKRDLRHYALRLMRDDLTGLIEIEKRWSLYGYSPEIVSNVLSCVATGLPLDAAIHEVTS